MTDKTDKPLTEREIAKRRDDAILRALKTPPKPLKEFTGKGRKSPKAKPRISRHQGR